MVGIKKENIPPRLWRFTRNVLHPRRLLRFDVHVTDHCNLNCKSCEHFSCISDEKFLDLDIYKRDMARLSELSGGVVEEIALVGGEPLLHADMIEIVKISRSYFPVGVLSIWTNGILLKQQPEAFWTALEENNVVINLSSYPIKLDVSAIEATAKAHNVTFIYSERDIEWRYIPIDLDGGQNRVDSFARCYAENRCFQLKEGRIYHCWRSAYVNYFNKAFGVDLQVTEEDYIDIYKADTINEILRFLRQVPSFCRYCIQRKEVHEEWGITKKSIDEWVMP